MSGARLGLYITATTVIHEEPGLACPASKGGGDLARILVAPLLPAQLWAERGCSAPWAPASGAFKDALLKEKARCTREAEAGLTLVLACICMKASEGRAGADRCLHVVTVQSRRGQAGALGAFSRPLFSFTYFCTRRM